MIRTLGSPENDLVLIDFSLAIVKNPQQTLKGLTHVGGTTNYMTPEHAIGYADASTDIYNLSKVTIEMIMGERFFVLVPDVALDLPRRVRILLSELPFTLPPSSIDLLSDALEFDPGQRPQSARLFADSIAMDLESISEN